MSFDYKDNDQVWHVAFSPHSKTIASSDKTVKLWRIDGSLITTLKGHEGYVNQVAFSRDGKTIASASFDSTVAVAPGDTIAKSVPIC